MKIKILAVLAAIFSLQDMAAQFINGQVVSAETGQPLENVRVFHAQSNLQVFTNAEGEFEIRAEIPAKLQFSLLGYTSYSETVTAEKVKIRLQPEIGQLSEVLIQAANIPKSVRELPASVSLIRSAELSKTDNFNLVQSFNKASGVFVNQGALNTNKITIRGIGARSQYSTNRIKAYLNGIPVTTAEGELTLDDLDPEIIEKVEIFKGPVSSVFGAGLGGAINLYTKDTFENSAGVQFDYGSFHTRKMGARAGFSKNDLSGTIFLTNLNSDGWRQNSAYERSSFNGNFQLKNTEKTHWNLFISATNLKAYIPSSLNLEDFRNTPEKAAFTWRQAAGYEHYNRQIAGISLSHSFSEKFSNLSSVFFTARNAYEPRPFNILDENRQSLGVRTKFNYESSFLKRQANLSFGTEAMREWYETGTFQNLYEEQQANGSLEGERLSLNNQHRQYLNLFAQANWIITEKFQAEAGASLNFTGYELIDDFDDSVDQSGKYNFSPVVSPRLGISYELFEEKNLYASASHGFSTPSVAETLTPEGLINTDLKTETGWNYEIGFKGNWFQKKLYTELNLYSIQVRNVLVARRVDNDQYVGVNAGKADHNGVEFTSVYQENMDENWQIQLRLTGNLTDYHFDRFVDLGENYSGNELPGVPEYSLIPSAEVEFKNFGFYLNYQAFGRMALNDANAVYTEAYQLLSSQLRYSNNLGKLDYSLKVGANNLFDEAYAASVVTNAVGFGGASPRFYYPGNPRNYYGSISVKYRF
ncbi:MAG: TonB-dependent receptor [Christiangramia sp.]|uniref:TonB-dependent receptor n=1 Tax=Christiangramia sp. TaxID=1931228 RepID=UPI003241ED6C